MKSRIARVKRTLKEDSAYKDLEAEYQKRQIHSQEVGMDTALYAQKTVARILRAEGWFWKTKTIWVGGGAETVRWLSLILPETLTEWIVSRIFGFSKLKRVEGEKN